MTGTGPPRLTRGPGIRPPVGIVHLGPGAFFRAFGAVYTAEAVQAHGGDWGILGVSLRSPEVRNALAPQGFDYTSVTQGPDGPRDARIDVIEDILVAPEDPGAVLRAMADRQVRIVSLTITEKGYCHNPATGQLNFDDTGIAHDITHADAPRTATGFIVHALARRRAAGHAPFTVLSCDNLPGNGALTRRVILDFAQRVDAGLADWIATNGRFPATMVDRITPATTGADIDALAGRAGYRDDGCVVHEPFRQWVIEDDFVGGARPRWDAGGAQFVADVAPFETMKLRCLNGTHSALAYLGYLAGHATIAEAVADPGLAAYVQALWQREIVPTLPPVPGVDLPGYCTALMARYRNPAIRHRTWQIAMDGSQKLPQRLLGTAQDALAAGRRCPGLALAVAAWMRYAGGIDEAGAPIDVRDPMAARLKAASQSATDHHGTVAALLDIREIFVTDLARNADFRDAVTTAYAHLLRHGARAAVASVDW